MGNFLVRYASRVEIYDRRAVIRLATGSNALKSWDSCLGTKSIKRLGRKNDDNINNDQFEERLVIPFSILYLNKLALCDRCADL